MRRSALASSSVRSVCTSSTVAEGRGGSGGCYRGEPARAGVRKTPRWPQQQPRAALRKGVDGRERPAAAPPNTYRYGRGSPPREWCAPSPCALAGTPGQEQTPAGPGPTRRHVWPHAPPASQQARAPPPPHALWQSEPYVRGPPPPPKSKNRSRTGRRRRDVMGRTASTACGGAALRGAAAAAGVASTATADAASTAAAATAATKVVSGGGGGGGAPLMDRKSRGKKRRGASSGVGEWVVDAGVTVRERNGNKKGGGCPPLFSWRHGAAGGGGSWRDSLPLYSAGTVPLQQSPHTLVHRCRG